MRLVGLAQPREVLAGRGDDNGAIDLLLPRVLLDGLDERVHDDGAHRDERCGYELATFLHSVAKCGTITIYAGAGAAPKTAPAVRGAERCGPPARTDGAGAGPRARTDGQRTVPTPTVCGVGSD